MTLQETISLLYLAKNMYPRDKSLDRNKNDLIEMAKVWAEMLGDVPFELGKAAVAAHAASSPYAPAISEIRAYARRMTEPEPLGPDEAWALAIGAIRRYGGAPYKNFATGKYPYERARESLPPDVWQVMERMGYQSMCRSEHEEVLRAQFIQAWERHQKRKAERESLLPFLPAGVKEKFLAVTDGREAAARK